MKDEEVRKVIRVGNSIFVNVPSNWAKKINLKEGEYVTEILKDSSAIEIRKIGGGQS